MYYSLYYETSQNNRFIVFKKYLKVFKGNIYNIIDKAIFCSAGIFCSCCDILFLFRGILILSKSKNKFITYNGIICSFSKKIYNRTKNLKTEQSIGHFDPIGDFLFHIIGIFFFLLQN